MRGATAIPVDRVLRLRKVESALPVNAAEICGTRHWDSAERRRRSHRFHPRADSCGRPSFSSQRRYTQSARRTSWRYPRRRDWYSPIPGRSASGRDRRSPSIRLRPTARGWRRSETSLRDRQLRCCRGPEIRLQIRCCPGYRRGSPTRQNSSAACVGISQETEHPLSRCVPYPAGRLASMPRREPEDSYPKIPTRRPESVRWDVEIARTKESINSLWQTLDQPAPGSRIETQDPTRQTMETPTCPAWK